MAAKRLPSTGKFSGTPNGSLERPAQLDENIPVAGLVDEAHGLVDRAIFTDEQIYQQELRRIYATSWLFLGHVDQVQKTGDFFTTYMGEDPIIVAKDAEGNINAMLNSCRHRGARVCRADYGATKVFTCTYHGWAFDLEGELKNVPNRDAYDENFKEEDWGLVRVPNVSVYKGLIFANWDPNAKSLEDYLGGMKYYMDAFLDRYPEGTEMVEGVMKWELEGNWKLAAEQFGTDWYHVNMSHASALMVLSPTGKGPAEGIANTPGRQFHSDEGHGAGFPVHPKSRFEVQAVHAATDYAGLRERLGDERVEGPLTTGHATVFPNFSYLPSIGSVRVWHPKGPDKMEVWTWTIIDKALPEEAKQAQRVYNLRTFGPSGIFESDDGENWSEVQAISGGFVTNNTALNLQMNIGNDKKDDIFPGITSDLYSDSAGRSFYGKWARVMDTPAWHEGEK